MNLIKKIKRIFCHIVFDHSYNRFPAIIKKYVGGSCRKTHLFLLYNICYEKAICFLASNIITRNANNKSLCE